MVKLGMNIILLFMVPMLFLFSIVILFACKPWRYLPLFRSSRFSSSFKLGDLQRPLVVSDDDEHLIQGQTSEDVSREYDLEGGLLPSSLTEEPAYKQQRLPSSSPPNLNQGESLVLQTISEPSDNALVGQTLKHPAEKPSLEGVETYGLQDNNTGQNLQHDLEKDTLSGISPGLVKDQRSWLCLEVIAGPSTGLQLAVHSTSTSKLPLNLGRVSPSGMILNAPEISGKHAQITWNSTKFKWELVDLGSLNGTLLNSRSVSHPDSGSRKCGYPVGLASEDIITLGTTTKVYVIVSSKNEFKTPFRIGVASDPMAIRRGGKKLPMEDVCYYKWPLPGANKFGLFCVCDGHGGAGAAQSAVKIIPEVLANILSDSLKEKVLSQREASDVLRDVLAKTEARLDDHLYEGCTATVLLVWKDSEENLFAQCANLGDSHCVINLDERYIQMTEDHRVSSKTERRRIQEAGLSLKEGDTRIHGLNLARMLGDKFMKEQDGRFSAEPYISEPLRIDQSNKDVFAVLASDGLWDVVSPRKAVQLVLQMREKERGTEDSAEKIAKSLLKEASDMRTKDNTSIIYLDFDPSL